MKDVLLGLVDEGKEWVVYWNNIAEYGGTGVGSGSASGAKMLNFWNCKWERE